MAMVELDQMKFELQSYENTLHEVKDSLDLEGRKKRIEELEMEMEAPVFWDDPDSSNRKMKELKFNRLLMSILPKIRIFIIISILNIYFAVLPLIMQDFCLHGKILLKNFFKKGLLKSYLRPKLLLQE